MAVDVVCTVACSTSVLEAARVAVMAVDVVCTVACSTSVLEAARVAVMAVDVVCTVACSKSVLEAARVAVVKSNTVPNFPAIVLWTDKAQFSRQGIFNINRASCVTYLVLACSLVEPKLRRDSVPAQAKCRVAPKEERPVETVSIACCHTAFAISTCVSDVVYGMEHNHEMICITLPAGCIASSRLEPAWGPGSNTRPILHTPRRQDSMASRSMDIDLNIVLREKQPAILNLPNLYPPPATCHTRQPAVTSRAKLQPIVEHRSSSMSRGGEVVRLLASHLGELNSIPGGVVPGFSYVGVVQDDAAGQRVFSGISHFPRPCILALLHTHLTSPSPALKTSILRTAKTSPLHGYNKIIIAARYDGNTARLARRSDEALGVRVTVARIAPSLLDLGRSFRWLLTARSREPMRVNEEITESRKTGDPRDNSPTIGIVRHDPHMQKSGVTWPEREPGSHRWEVSRLTAQPPRPPVYIKEGDILGGGICLRFFFENETCDILWAILCWENSQMGVLAAVVKRLDYSPPTKASRVRSPAGSLPDFRMWESCRTMPLVGRIYRGTPVSPAPSFRSCPIRTSPHLSSIGSQDLDIKSRPNIFTLRSLRW
ncbi:hypothetical protein PR048_024123 [Dryococelus australis]|uniref:Uncharacterized protein n=1 Tax=Dryococelus australis TaxID=614101 RepID=A0ABQ9GW20_9NEOP|nr:hypothetical protein PR048_024123 [Dryococelus australis]